MRTSLPNVPTEANRRRPTRRTLPVMMFLATLLALATLAALSLLIPPRPAEGLPDDPLARDARAALAGGAALGFEGLRFRSALLGEADPERPIPIVEQRPAAHAESLLLEVARRRPFDPRAHAALGSLALARRRWAEAEGRFRRALELRAVCPEARLGLGVALAEQALIQTDPLRARALELRAIGQFAAVPAGAEVYPHALYDRAILLARVGRGREARRLAAEYLARDSTNAWATRLRGDVGPPP